MAIPKRLKTIVALAETQGWTVVETKGKHIKMVPPNGTKDPQGRVVSGVLFARTPSDHRSDLNSIAMLRRLGVPVEHKGHNRKKKDR